MTLEDGSVQSQDLGSVILVGPFKLSTFCDSVNFCAYGKRRNMQNMGAANTRLRRNQAMENCST